MTTVCVQVVQLEELLAVRHSVFVVGNAGTGKSKVGELMLYLLALEESSLESMIFSVVWGLLLKPQ